MSHNNIRYLRLFETARDGILILDAKTLKIIDANPFICELLGHPHVDMLGKELWQIGLFKDIDLCKTAAKEVQEKGYIRYEDLPLETKAGLPVHVEFVSNVYLEEDDQFVIQCNIRDISVRKESENQLRILDERLAVIARNKDEFLATLAHEFRNPLAPICSGLQILQAKKWDEETEQILRIMDRQARHLSRMISDLFDVSRVTLGKITLHCEAIALDKVITSSAESVHQNVKDHSHKFTVLLPLEILLMSGDPTRLEQVFVNLLNNAIKFTKPGGNISITAVREDKFFVVRIKDDGVGIEAHLLPTVFDLFTQGRRTLDRSDGGLGVGLTLVKRLVELHGGTIEVHSPGPNQGSEFVLRLPA